MPKCYIPGYPRPQFVRRDWSDLNGTWDFAFDDALCGESEEWYRKDAFDRKILVPFTYETKTSGIGEEKAHPAVWYTRTVAVPSEWRKNRVLLHFEGCDYLTKVWVNGQMAGTHRGGYARFSFDITALLQDGENRITVCAEDSFDRQQPRGKQRWLSRNYGCWYVQTTGIWKPVWMECVPQDSVASVKMTPNVQDQLLRVDWKVDAEQFDGALQLEASVEFDGVPVSRMAVPVMDKRGRMDIPVTCVEIDEWGICKWTPETPNLYDITFRLIKDGACVDQVDSYFGMREIRTENGKVLLNGRPLYQKLILDQGYWKDSHLTPPDEAAIISEIEKLQEMGFNGARKHQKTEDERYAYWCDVKGFLMWCEMPSAYDFGDDEIENFTREWMEIVRQNYNHPAIITWTPFNESWGVPEIHTNRMQQHFTQGIYYLTKAFDPMRPVVSNDGWEHTSTDLVTLHDYEEEGKTFLDRYLENKDGILDGTFQHNKERFAFAQGCQYEGQPVLLTEYGGIAFTDGQEGWGYGNKVVSEEDFLRRLENITDAMKEVPYLCGYCYTQVSDVQQEINGLFTADRKSKVSVSELRRINQK